MHPDERRRGKIQQGTSRARILLKKNLGWLPGFPLADQRGSVRWWCLPPGAMASEVVSIDRERLRRMEMTLTRLRHRFPNALPKVVEDVDDWLNRMDHLLVMFKEAIHRRRAMDVGSWPSEEALSRRWRGRFSNVCNRHKPLRPLLDAVLFLQMTGLGRPSMEALDWIDQHAPSLLPLATVFPAGEKSLEAQLLLYFLRGEMHPALQRVLFECVADQSVWTLPSGNVYHHAQQLSTQLRSAADRKPFNERFRLTILAHAAGVAESAERLLASLRPNSLPVRLKRYDCEHCCAFHGIGSYQEVFDLLIDHSPTLALRTIRGTRARDVCRDADEKHRQRRSALAKIHRLLGRDRLATQLAGKDS